MLGGLALGLSTTSLGYAATHLNEDSAPQLRMTLELSRPGRQPAVAAAPASSTAVSPSPFRLRWEESLSVAQLGANITPLGPPRDEEETTAPPATIDLRRKPLPKGTPSAPPSDPESSGSKYGLAPIRWGGQFGYAYSTTRREESDRIKNHIYDLRLRAASYILQPWLARVNGDLALALIDTTSDSPDSADSGSVAVTGQLALSVFPASRFPFTADLSVSDTRTDGGLASSDQRSYRLNMRQEYRPPRGFWQSHGTFSASLIEGAFGDDVVYRLGGGYKWAREKHSVDALGSFSRSDAADAAASETLLAQAEHNYRHDSATVVDTNATYARVEVGSSTIGASDVTTSVAQVFSTATWNPSDSKWRASATGRLTRTESSSGSSNLASTIAAASVASAYRANRNLNVTGSASITGSPDEGRSTTTVLTTTANYAGDPLVFGNTSYNWSLSSGLSRSASGGESNVTANVGASHGVGHNWSLGERTSLTGSLSQGANASRSKSENSSSTRSLSHSASLALVSNPTDATLGAISTSFSDSRTYGDDTSTFQALNVQINGNWRVSPRSSLSGNLTWQRSRQDAARNIDPLTGETLQSESDTTSLNGTINYSNARAFAVRGLFYQLQFSASSAQGNQRQLGNPDAERESETRRLDQRLNYRIGRLDTQLQLTFAEVDGKKNARLFFRVSRSFGAF